MELLALVALLGVPAMAGPGPAISSGTVDLRQLNATMPPKSPPVLKKAGDLSKPAVGPGYTIMPLPAFVYDRNEGAWIGGLTPIFRANAQGQVEDIYAPLYLHNKFIGETFTMNYFGYRHETTSYHVILSRATKIEHDYEFGYQNLAASDGRYIVGLQAFSNKSAFNRFFGFGNNTVETQETQYTMSDNTLKFSGGINFSRQVALIATERYRDVHVEDGASPTLPQTVDQFPDVPGINGASIVGQGLTLSYDSRDNANTPLQGSYATFLTEYDENIKFSERNHWWRLTGEDRNYWPHADDRAVFVSHLLLDGVVGQDENSSQEDTIEQDTGQVDDFGNPILQPVISRRLVRQGVPYYERPTLGGDTTLRGFGRGRYVSNFAWLVNFEERIRVFHRAIMGTVVELEAAPFIDIGRVGRSITADGIIKDAQINPGIGLRMLARPNIAGRSEEHTSE